MLKSTTGTNRPSAGVWKPFTKSLIGFKGVDQLLSRLVAAQGPKHLLTSICLSSSSESTEQAPGVRTVEQRQNRGNQLSLLQLIACTETVGILPIANQRDLLGCSLRILMLFSSNYKTLIATTIMLSCSRKMPLLLCNPGEMVVFQHHEQSETGFGKSYFMETTTSSQCECQDKLTHKQHKVRIWRRLCEG